MSAALWLAARELRARWRRVALAAAVVAAITAAATATEVVGRAREEAVAARLDDVGPALTIAPAGVSANALARLAPGGGRLAGGLEARVEAILGGDLRRIERRLVVTRSVAGLEVPVVGVDRAETAGLAAGGVLLGAELARRLDGRRTVAMNGRAFEVRGALPSTGDAEDLAVLMPLEAAQALEGSAALSELRLHLAAGVPAAESQARLVAAGLGAEVVRHDRGAIAGGELQASLARHRGLAYAVMALVGTLCLLIASHLDASERRVEVSTLVAIGASPVTIAGAVVARSVLLALAGALVGVTAGFGLSALQDATTGGALARGWSVGATTLLAAAALAALAAAPTGLAAALRDPVAGLEES